jgi:hypothetical protein
MALKTVFHDIADVPEKFRELYSETSPGVWSLTGIEGVGTEQELQTRLRELERRSAEADKIRAACEKNGIAPDEFENLSERFAALKTKLAGRDSELRAERIRNELRETALKMGVRPEALSDVLARASIFEIGEGGDVRSKAENGGVGVCEWLGKQLKESPHWLTPSRSAGVRQNPFSHTRPVRDCSMAELIAESWNKLK